MAFPGLSVNGFVNVPNAAVMFFMLDPFESRTSADLGALAIAGRLQAKFASIPDGFLRVFPPPPYRGWEPSAASRCRSRIAAAPGWKPWPGRPRC